MLSEGLWFLIGFLYVLLYNKCKCNTIGRTVNCLCATPELVVQKCQERVTTPVLVLTSHSVVVGQWPCWSLTILSTSLG